MNAIEIRGVSKTFGSHRAVNDLSLEVPDGSIYGFIGPNGSGKTTTIRMIMNIILPDSGQISVLGQQSSGAARDAVGYLPEERGMVTVRVYDRYLLAPYATFDGPAVIEERESTLIVGRGAKVSVDPLLDVVIEIERENGEATGAGK